MEPTRINNPGQHPQGGYNQGGQNYGYNNGYNQGGYNNMPPRKNGSSTALIIGIIAGVVLCGVVFLIVYLVKQNQKMEEKLEAVEMKHNHEDNDDVKVPQAGEAKESAKAVSSGVLKSGSNYMKGSFNYAGANYGFSLSFNYNPSTGQASGGRYEADGYGGSTKVSVSVTNGGRNIVASGNSTYINISAPAGSTVYSGSMTRGTHSGSCRVTLY